MPGFPSYCCLLVLVGSNVLIKDGGCDYLY